jgi:twitching motility protein PilT
MNPIDGLLKMVAAQQADELRLGVGRAPVVLAGGVPKNLTLAETGERVLRQMLGPLLSKEAESCLEGGAPFATVYDGGPALGAYQVRFRPRLGGEPDFDITLTRTAQAAPEAQKNHGASDLANPTRPHGTRPAPPPEAAQAPPEAAQRRATGTLEALLARAVAMGASDVHVRQGEAAYCRIDGHLVRLESDPHDLRELMGDTLVAANLDPGEAPVRSVDMSLTSPSAGRVRLHVFRVGGLAALAARLLPPTIPTLSELGFPVDLHDLAALPNGLVLVTGPTGSGKSTTAASLCQEAIRQRSCVLVTLEDPIEYCFDTSGTSSLVRQRQIGVDVPNFSAGLRDALREDPDVVLVGEMRDAESIGLALTAAETGHLVFASLHSRSAASAIERVVDAYPAAQQHQLRAQLSESLRAVVSQRLLPRARGNGRVAALEVLRRNAAVANLIREGKTPQLVNVLQSSRKQGMVQLERSLADLCRSGTVEERQARVAANDQDALTEYLQTHGKTLD